MTTTPAPPPRSNGSGKAGEVSSMTWNHRVVQQKLKGKKSWLSVREVFYNDKREIMGYTENLVGVCGENLEELRSTAQLILSCLEDPILIEGEFKVVGFDEPKRAGR